MKRPVKSKVDKLRLRKRNGKLAFPELHCGPGPTCQAASGASVDAIRSILIGGTSPAEVQECNDCQARAIQPELREI